MTKFNINGHEFDGSLPEFKPYQMKERKTVDKKRKPLGERWPWNKLVRRPRQQEWVKDEAADREADREEPLTGDISFSQPDERTPEK